MFALKQTANFATIDSHDNQDGREKTWLPTRGAQCNRNGKKRQPEHRQRRGLITA
jgi:hypothetical protein